MKKENIGEQDQIVLKRKEEMSAEEEQKLISDAKEAAKRLMACKKWNVTADEKNGSEDTSDTKNAVLSSV